MDRVKRALNLRTAGGWRRSGGAPGSRSSSGSATSGSTARLLAQGEQALAAGNAYGAIEAFSGALALRPGSMVAYFRRGEAYRTEPAGRGDGDLREAARLAPDAPQPLIALGDLYERAGTTPRPRTWYGAGGGSAEGRGPGAALPARARPLSRRLPADGHRPRCSGAIAQRRHVRRSALPARARAIATSQQLRRAPSPRSSRPCAIEPTLPPRAKSWPISTARRAGRWTRCNSCRRSRRAMARSPAASPSRWPKRATASSTARSARSPTRRPRRPTDSRVQLALGRVHLARAERTRDRDVDRARAGRPRAGARRHRAAQRRARALRPRAGSLRRPRRRRAHPARRRRHLAGRPRSV